MTPEREKLIRETWARVRDWPTRSPRLNVAIIRPMHLRPFSEEDARRPIDTSKSYLTFEKGLECSEDGSAERFFIQCEGLRVVEEIAPRGTWR